MDGAICTHAVARTLKMQVSAVRIRPWPHLEIFAPLGFTAQRGFPFPESPSQTQRNRSPSVLLSLGHLQNHRIKVCKSRQRSWEGSGPKRPHR